MQTINDTNHDSGPAPHPHQRLASQIGLIYRQWRKILDMRLRGYGLTGATWTPLVALAKAGRPLRQKELAEQLFLDTSSMVRVLNQLRETALIDWTTDPEDRRAKAISLTSQGRELVTMIEGASLSLEQEVLKDIAPDEIAITRKVLGHIALKVVEIGNRERDGHIE
ncbi:MAG TPA: MarR family transcriptional regulator [Pseudogulbenkiania sp.]|nr:MarR family transcriptional regulator [Pseudogulbenkiania sp.]